ncbi:TSUP family transporter [Labrenzia sp. PHM005]|uniref:TSUP family transporter n=1 Tax=Labrenzia sp. PHM005 TaxID=2590016 RepID=UPI001140862C|nr:TSUP family transporter [Labrenzia sp. PHM005]QDG76014.1 hypothetical protein FJ695_09120 [Labrenzia sp. PHM005]
MLLDVSTLLIAVFAGSVLQAGVGIGFSIVVAPVMMISLGVTTAVPLLLLLNTLVSAAAIDLRSWPQETGTITRSILSAFVGICAGLTVYSLFSEGALLLTTAAFLFFGLVVNFVQVPPVLGRHGAVAFSGVSGLATVWTATPGPLIILGLLTSGRSAQEARVLVQPVAFAGYGAAFLLHGAFNGALVSNPSSIAPLVVAAIVGALAGRVAGKHLPQKLIKTAICVISVAACVALVRQAYLLG